MFLYCEKHSLAVMLEIVLLGVAVTVHLLNQIRYFYGSDAIVDRILQEICIEPIGRDSLLPELDATLLYGLKGKVGDILPSPPVYTYLYIHYRR